jgi:hypothetical protein
LIRFWAEGNIVKSIILAAKGTMLMAPDAREQPKLFIGNLAAFFKGRAHGCKLLLHPADSDPHDQSAGGEMINGGRDLGPIKRMAIG